MIIDLHTQIWANLDQLGHESAERIRTRTASRGVRIDASAEAHAEAMRCVDGAAVIGYRSGLLQAGIPNEFLAAFVKRDPSRHVFIAGIDPLAADAADEFNKALTIGAAAIAVSPTSQGFHPAHTSAMRLYDMCAERSLPVFVTMQEPLTPRMSLERARPASWDEVARAFPTLPIVINRLGFPWIDETLAMLAKHDRIFADVAGIATQPWQIYNVLLAASGFGVLEKLFFASGFPFETPARAIEALYSVNAFCMGTNLPTVQRSLIRGIIERDSLGCLGIANEIRPTVSVVEEPVQDDDDEDLVTSAGELRRKHAEQVDSWEDEPS